MLGMSGVPTTTAASPAPVIISIAVAIALIVDLPEEIHINSV